MYALMILFVLAIITIAGPAEVARRMSEALSNFRRPGPPTHPLPANDSWILNRRRRKREAQERGS